MPHPGRLNQVYRKASRKVFQHVSTFIIYLCFYIFFDVQKLSLCANGRQAPAAASVYYKPARRINPPDGLAKAPRLWASHAATTACARRTTRGH